MKDNNKTITKIDQLQEELDKVKVELIQDKATLTHELVQAHLYDTMQDEGYVLDRTETVELIRKLATALPDKDHYLLRELIRHFTSKTDALLNNLYTQALTDAFRMPDTVQSIIETDQSYYPYDYVEDYLLQAIEDAENDASDF